MKKTDLRRASGQDLIQMITEYGLEVSRLMRKIYIDGPSERTKAVNRLTHRIHPVYVELAARGPEARRQFLQLLDHPDKWLRYTAAGILLPVEEEKARAALERISAEAHQYDEIGFYARMKLTTWDEKLGPEYENARPKS